MLALLATWGLLAAATAASGQSGPVTSAPGIAVAPAVMAPPALPRGTSRTETLILTNDLDGDQTVALGAAGEVAPWLAFVDADGAPMTEVTVPRGGVTLVDVLVRVPAEVANGTYLGQVELTPGDDATVAAGATAAAAAAGAAGATTSIVVGAAAPTGAPRSELRVGAVVPVKVQVGGEMVLQGRLLDVRTPLAEVGQPQRIVASFANGGTVGFQPTIEATISRSGLPVAVLRAAGDTAVGPGRSTDVELQWDTTEAVPGRYDLDVKASAEGLAFDPVKTSFRLEPVGSALRDGEIESMEVVGRPEPGGSARVRAVFRNRSDVAVTAVLVTDVEVNGRLTGQLQSLPVVVAAGRRMDLDLVLDQLEVGSYDLTGLVNFDGRQTDQSDVRFDVRAPSTRSSGGGDRSTLLLGAAVGLVVLGMGTVIVRRRRGARDDDDDF